MNVNVNVIELVKQLNVTGADCRCGNISTDTIFRILDEMMCQEKEKCPNDQTNPSKPSPA